jgi:prepilin-type N-terminal cleavage/methylation domain-containing protein
MKSRKGFNLVEAVIAMVIIAVAAAGTLSCEFFVAKHSRQARAEMIAARTVQLLLDDWKACKGTENYDPVASLNCGFTQASGKYLVTVDALPLYLSLSSADINSTANTHLKQITVTAEWRDDYSEGLTQNNSLALTTYCQ